MIKIIIFLIAILSSNPLHCQTTTSATYYESGINSPWFFGFDYDFGFGKFFSLNIQLAGGVASQVNRVSTFGDVFMGELQFGARVYMGEADVWKGLYLTTVARVGVYDVPTRVSDSMLIINRETMMLLGAGVYFGYKWKRNYLQDSSDFPFNLVIEPFMGWTLDFLNPINSTFQSSGAVNRFSVGLSLKVSFFTYKKSKETLEKEAENSEESENTEEEKES